MCAVRAVHRTDRSVPRFEMPEEFLLLLPDCYHLMALRSVFFSFSFRILKSGPVQTPLTPPARGVSNSDSLLPQFGTQNPKIRTCWGRRCRNPFSRPIGYSRRCIREEDRMSGQVAKLAAVGSFGIAVLGLYLILNSTNASMSLSACVMFIVGTVVGVLLLQPNK